MANSAGLRWYKTGTITVAAGSTTVTGSGTSWVDVGIKPGDILTVDRSTLYEIASVNSNTSITLATAMASGVSNGGYFIIRNFAGTLEADLAADVARLNAYYQSWIDNRLPTIENERLQTSFSFSYKGTWAANVAYKTLDIVLYNSVPYVCVLAHTSTSSITPANANYWATYAPSVPSGIDVFNFNCDGLHNSIYRGKNLGIGVTDAQYAAIANGTFNDLWIGDYWDVQNLAHEYYDENGDPHYESFTGKLVIADFNYFLRCGDSDFTAPHIVVVPLNSMYNHVMNDTDTTTGGYVNSKMRLSGLNKAKAIYNAFFGAAHVKTHREYLINTVENGQPAAGGWVDSTVELIDERQAYGSLIYDSGLSNGQTVRNRYSVANSQFNLFRLNKRLISNRLTYWLRNVVSAAVFAIVTTYGNCNYFNASYAFGVRPAALIA